MTRVDYDAVLDRYRWLSRPSQDCVISGDADGFLCGLLMSTILGWTVRGYYDGSFLVLNRHLNPRRPVYLDIEILRRGVRSVGQHMVAYDPTSKLGDPIKAFGLGRSACLSPNGLRGFGAKTDYNRKYPFGTIHLLLMLISRVTPLPKFRASAAAPLLFVDGTFSNLFKYPENCADWMDYLRMTQAGSPLRALFKRDCSLSALMESMNEFYRQRDLSNATCVWRAGACTRHQKPHARSGHVLEFVGNNRRMSRREPVNLEPGRTRHVFTIHSHERDRIEKFLKLLAAGTGLEYRPASWSWGDMKRYAFGGSRSMRNVGAKRFGELVGRKKPLTLNILGSGHIQYTIDREKLFGRTSLH